MLNCHVHSYGNLRPNVTVELTDEQSGRLTFQQYSSLNYSTELLYFYCIVKYNMNVTSSMSGPFYCNVTGTVGTMETVSKTFSVTVSRLLGELFRHVTQDNITVITVFKKSS